jgi:putative transposase
MKLFDKEDDYRAFRRILHQALERIDVRLCAYCLMPNHFHLVVWPRRDRELSQFMAWLTLTHTQRWHAHRHSAGAGHVYQGRFKSFPIQENEHFATVCRYVERNPLRAGLVKQALDWPWSSLQNLVPSASVPPPPEEAIMLSPWPIPQLPPQRWLAWVKQPQNQGELESLRRCVNRGQPWGTDAWSRQTAVALGLESTFRPRGRPRKAQGGEIH